MPSTSKQDRRPQLEPTTYKPSSAQALPLATMKCPRFGSTAKVLLKCKLKYYRIRQNLLEAGLSASRPGEMSCPCSKRAQDPPEAGLYALHMGLQLEGCVYSQKASNSPLKGARAESLPHTPANCHAAHYHAQVVEFGLV